MEGPRGGTGKHREIDFINPCMMCGASLRGNYRIKTTKTIMRWAITYENARNTAACGENIYERCSHANKETLGNLKDGKIYIEEPYRRELRKRKYSPEMVLATA